MEEYKVGDKVVFDSNGIVMTVTGVSPEKATCTWFSGTSLQEHEFPKSLLNHHVEKATPDFSRFAKNRTKKRLA